MHILLIVIHVIACVAIIGLVLLQAGKGADIGSAFGGAGSQAVFGSMGTPTVLGKMTTTVAIVFALTSFTLAIYTGERTGSVVRDQPPAREAAPVPAADPAPAGEPAPTPAPGAEPRSRPAN